MEVIHTRLPHPEGELPIAGCMQVKAQQGRSYESQAGTRASLTEPWKHRTLGLCLLGRGGLCAEALGPGGREDRERFWREVRPAQTWALSVCLLAAVCPGAPTRLSECKAPPAPIPCRA